MSIIEQNRMLERLNRLRVPIPPQLASRGVAVLAFSVSGDLLIIKATLFDRPQKRFVTAEYHEPEWWRPNTSDQAQKLFETLVERLRLKLSRS